MKILVAQFQQESNSFSPIKCGIEMFRNSCLVYGEEVLKMFKGTSTELNGAITAIEAAGAIVVPSIAASSVSSGAVTGEVFELVLQKVILDFRMHKPDGIYICLHGAMLVEGFEDGTGEFIKRIREEAGNSTIIAGSLDFHANVTKTMIASANILVGYHTYPHIDLYETGYKTAKLLINQLQEKIHPKMVLVKIPMIVPGEACQTSSGFMKKVMDAVIEAENKHKVLSASVFQMQPWLDVQDAGCSVIAVADGESAEAEEIALGIAKLFWSFRKELKADLWDIEDIINIARHDLNIPVILADSADGTGSGSPGDSTFVLSEIMQKAKDLKAYVTIVDAAAVALAIETGVGNFGEFIVGGSLFTYNNPPLKIKGYVKLISDGRFVFKGPQFTGKEHRMGRTAVILNGNLSIVVMEKSAFNWDPELYRSVGLEPNDANIVVVKSPNAFKAAYVNISSRHYVVDAPGPSSPKLTTLPYKVLQHPMYPFEQEFDNPEFKVYS